LDFVGKLLMFKSREFSQFLKILRNNRNRITIQLQQGFLDIFLADFWWIIGHGSVVYLKRNYGEIFRRKSKIGVEN